MDRPAPEVNGPQGRDDRLHGQVEALADRLGLSVEPGRLRGARGVRGTVVAARKAGLPILRRQATWEALAAAAPAIAVLSDGNSVLVTGIEDHAGTPVAMLDEPGEAGRAGPVDRRRFEAAWTGEIIVLRPPPTPDGWRLTRRSMARLLLGEPRLLRDLGGATVGLALLAVVPVLFIQLALGRILVRHASQTLAASLAILGAVLLLELALRALASFCAGRLGARWRARLSAAVLDRLLRLPPGDVESCPAGEVRSRMRGFDAAHRSLSLALPRALFDGAMALAALPVLLVLDWPIALVALAVLGGGALSATQVMQRLRRAATRRADAEGRRDAALLRVCAEPSPVKGLAVESEWLAEWEELAAQTATAEAGMSRSLDRLTASVVPLDRLVLLGSLGLGVVLPVVTGEPVPMPALLAAVLLLQRFSAPLARLPSLLGAAADAQVARQSLASLVNRPLETGGPTEPLEGGLAFEHVGVRYPGVLRPALEGVSFAIDPGAFVGVFGPSGAGKSTLARLVARAALASSGVVRLDGRDARGLDPAAVRRQVLVVTGRPTIVAGTVRDTITARKPDATFDEMSAAARLAGVDEFVERLPRGYETTLAAGAPTLSAGQRQRLALARAVIARPAILVLDEALGAIDVETEDLVLDRLRAARTGATTILISHRAGSLAVANCVLVLADGRLIDQGTPTDLAERCDLLREAAMREAAFAGGDDDRFGRLLALG